MIPTISLFRIAYLAREAHILIKTRTVNLGKPDSNMNNFKKYIFIFIISLLSYSILASTALGATVPSAIINWSGFIWEVIPPHVGNPGNNHWSDSMNNVWVDGQNKLHLKITNVSGT